MKANSIIFALTLVTAGSGSAFADGGPYPPDDLFAVGAIPSKSRAEVTAETAAASRLGLLNFGEAGPRQATPAEERIIAEAGRQAVLAEGGTYSPDNTFVAEPIPSKSRAEVRAETAAAFRLGLLNFGEAGPREATAEEERIIAEAGRQAALAEQRDLNRTTLSESR